MAGRPGEETAENGGSELALSRSTELAEVLSKGRAESLSVKPDALQEVSILPPGLLVVRPGRWEQECFSAPRGLGSDSLDAQASQGLVRGSRGSGKSKVEPLPQPPLMRGHKGAKGATMNLPMRNRSREAHTRLGEDSGGGRWVGRRDVKVPNQFQMNSNSNP